LQLPEINIFRWNWRWWNILSSDNGKNWIAKSTGLTDLFINTIAINGNNIFAGTYSDGIFLSTDNGEITGKPKNSGLTDLFIKCISN